MRRMKAITRKLRAALALLLLSGCTPLQAPEARIYHDSPVFELTIELEDEVPVSQRLRVSACGLEIRLDCPN